MAVKYVLTPVEQELMEILWALGQGTVHDVLAKLPDHRQLAYTSVSTILRILQQKKILTIKRMGRTHIYQPLLPKKIYAEHSVKTIVKNIFSDNPVELVSYLLDKRKVTLQQINAIQQLITNKKKALV